jgi:hypothetical protein
MSRANKGVIADMYMNAVTDNTNAALRARPGGQVPAPALGVGAPSTSPATNDMDSSAPTGVAVPPVATPDDPDAAPASAPPKSKTPPPSEGSANGKERGSEDELSKFEQDAAVALKAKDGGVVDWSKDDTMVNGHLL